MIASAIFNPSRGSVRVTDDRLAAIAHCPASAPPKPKGRKTRLLISGLLALGWWFLSSSRVAADPSSFVITEVTFGQGAVTLKWTSQTARSYRVERSDGLLTWETLAASHPPGGAGGTSTEFTDATPPAAGAYYRVVALEPPPPPGFVLIPEGSFMMGDALNEGQSDALPVHEVYISAFYLQATETTKSQWDGVRAWALDHGYDFSNEGGGKGPDHPVHTVNWFDAVKWCNARSEKEGLVPCYYTDTGHTLVYRSGLVQVTNAMVDWSADGYRLPTEAEWEKAARGGLTGRRFPLGNTISHTQENYYSSSAYAYDIGPTRGLHPSFRTGLEPFTAPVGSLIPNAYGLYDLIGNLREWCWDYYGWNYYSWSPRTDPRGPSTDTSGRVFRGTSYRLRVDGGRVSYRDGDGPGARAIDYGFRPARRR